MRQVPTVPGGLGDEKLVRFLYQLVKVLQNQQDVQCYTSTVVWIVPLSLYIPTGWGTPRQGPPSSVLLTTATLDSAPQTVIEVGTTPTWKWVGNDTVQILDAAGLVENAKYNLTFTVIG